MKHCIVIYHFRIEVNTVSTTCTVRDNMRFLAFLKEAYLLPRPLGGAFAYICKPNSGVFVLTCWPHRGAYLQLSNCPINARGNGHARNWLSHCCSSFALSIGFATCWPFLNFWQHRYIYLSAYNGQRLIMPFSLTLRASSISANWVTCVTFHE